MAWSVYEQRHSKYRPGDCAIIPAGNPKMDSGSPFTAGDTSKTPRGYPKPQIALNPQTLCFSYTYLPMIKLNLYIRHSKK